MTSISIPSRAQGVFAPVLTPFKPDLSIDVAPFVAHCRRLIDCGVGLAIFGTNSEAASIAIHERFELTDAILAAGVPANRLMPGTGACSITDAVTLTRHAVGIGALGTLVLPPFFFKGVSDDGLFAYYSEIIERTGSSDLRLYLYHIPQFSHAPISKALIERLRKRYPGAVAGIKDSSGDWANTVALLHEFAGDGFSVFPSSEATLAKALPLGAAGCISATANVNPAGIVAAHEQWHSTEGPALQAAADAVRAIFQSVPMIAAMKFALAVASGLDSWATVRPPLTPLDAHAGNQLLSALSDMGFGIPGLSPKFHALDSLHPLLPAHS
jgi:4-hydroxy-tetrahydrodipicolinate synthase